MQGYNATNNYMLNEIQYIADYFPYGKVLREYVNGDKERYLTTQHERDNETGLDYRGARYYDSDVARFLSLDPLASDYPSWSDYNYVMGNPIMLIDPTGRSASPIYDKEGDFLGTDDEGLQGEAIVMDKRHFEQGMTHNEAKAYDVGSNGMTVEQQTKMNDHFNGLPDRPDYDGVLTFGEVTKWSNEGSGEPLFVDGSKII